jgi:DNA-binding CsgD family transcriptional regulator
MPLLIALGLGLLVTETNMALNLADATSSLGETASFIAPGVTFTLSRMVFYILLAVFPQFFKRNGFAFTLFMPFLAFLGTATIMLASESDASTTRSIVQFGLCLKGLGYGWILVSFFMKLIRNEGFTSIVFVATTALLFKTIAGNILGLYLPVALQGVISLVFLVACLLLLIIFDRMPEVASPLATVDTNDDDRVPLALQVAIFALAVSTMGVMSDFGIRISSPAATVQAPLVFLRLLLSIVIIASLSYLFLGRKGKRGILVRMQMAFLIVLAGFFIIAMRGYGVLNTELVYQVIITISGVFIHILFWVAVLLMMQNNLRDGLRIIGIAEALSNGMSSIWFTFLSQLGPISNTVTLIAAYAFTVLIMIAGRFIHVPSKKPEIQLEENMSDRIKELSEHYRLSPRESEVFALLAKGFTRNMIEKQLVLSDSTIKTHISHIYEKMDIHTKQDLFKLILSDEPLPLDGATR